MNSNFINIFMIHIIINYFCSILTSYFMSSIPHKNITKKIL